MASDDLSIEAIFVSPFSKDAVHTESYLSSLSDTDWADLRENITRSKKSGKPVLLCGDCRSPVYVKESVNGRRHCAHFGTDIKDCRWFSANAQNFRSIDAHKFHGNQEGERHKQLKEMICEILSFDPTTHEGGIVQERYTKGVDGEYAFPDVFVSKWQNGSAAFEIQLSTTQIPTIVRREIFYKTNLIRLCWIVDRVYDEQLSRRSFKDIYLRNDGQIFGVDEEVLKKARHDGRPQFRLYRLLPKSVRSDLTPHFRDRIVSPDEINWGEQGDRPKSVCYGYDAYLDNLIERDAALSAQRREFYKALSEGSEKNAKCIWDAAAEIFTGKKWKDLGSDYDTIQAFGVLATMRLGTLAVKTKIKFNNQVHLINSILLEPQQRRCWTHAFKLIAQNKAPDVLAVPSIGKKCDRNLTDQVSCAPADLAAGQVFNFFFPEGAFQRLQLDGKVKDSQSAFNDYDSAINSLLRRPVW
uniref:DUF6035 domain-containing protein n=1 Tax=Desulfovibrio sp. U5L TaxID=596152 RepID=I2Q6L1_9BACT